MTVEVTGVKAKVLISCVLPSLEMQLVLFTRMHTAILLDQVFQEV